jgi:hypothetical protein
MLLAVPTSAILGINALHSFLKQVGVCSGPLENNPVGLNHINQQPVGFNMAFTSTLPIAKQLMVSMNVIKRFFRHYGTNDYFQLFKVFAAFFHPFSVTLKLP